MKRITVKKARLIAGMTEKEVCTALRIRKDRLEAWETGKSVPSIEHASALANAYDIPIDYLDFSKEANTPPTARKLTLEEIKSLPFASVIWVSCVSNNNGVIWHWKMPAVIGVSGENGIIVGGNDDSILIKEIDKLRDDHSYTIWTHEPDDTQIPGISEEEYNSSPNEEEIVSPDAQRLAEAITGRKMTFRDFCKRTGIDFEYFWDGLTGKRDFVASDLASIAEALETTVDKIFSADNITQI